MTCHCCDQAALLSGELSGEIVGDVFHRWVDGEIRHVCGECAADIDEALEPDGVSANPADFMEVRS